MVTPFDDREVARAVLRESGESTRDPARLGRARDPRPRCPPRSARRRSDHEDPRRLAACDRRGSLRRAQHGRRVSSTTHSRTARRRSCRATSTPRSRRSPGPCVAARVRRSSRSSARPERPRPRTHSARSCAAVVPTVAAEASKNNEIGLPLTVLRLERDTEVLVTEMGMRGHGQIAELCAIAAPHVALVTSIGPEHLELVGTVADVARANAEAIAALPAGGIAVVPADTPELEPFLERTDIELRRFDRTAVERVTASDRLSLASRWRFQVDGQTLELELPFDQRHLVENVLAALTAYDALGPTARAGAGRCEPDQALGLERGGSSLARRWGRGQRRVQRKPHLDARGVARSRRARGRPAACRRARRDGRARCGERSIPRRDRRAARRARDRGGHRGRRACARVSHGCRAAVTGSPTRRRIATSRT